LAVNEWAGFAGPRENFGNSIDFMGFLLESPVSMMI